RRLVELLRNEAHGRIGVIGLAAPHPDPEAAAVVPEDGPARDAGEVVARTLRRVEAQISRWRAVVEDVAEWDADPVAEELGHQLREPGADGEDESLRLEAAARLEGDVD